MKECEICKTEISTDTHHIQSTTKGGENIYSNRCELCPNCHRLVHTGEIILEGRFLTSSSKKGETDLVFRNKGEPSITGFKDPDVWIYGDNKEIIYCFKEDELI
jgi:hypothetical protein